MTERAKHPVRTTEKTLRIIEELKERHRAGVTELADALGLNKSVVHNHLSTLEQHEYVLNEGDDYRLSLKFLDIGGYTRKQMRLYNVVGTEVNQLADETGELVSVMTEEYGRGVYLYRLMGDDAVNLSVYSGYRVPLNCTAPGKAILAQLPDDRVEAVVDRHGLPARTGNTITDRADLDAELERVRERGYAADDEEHTEGLRCVAAPIVPGDRGVVGAIGVSAPTNRLRGDRFESEVPELVRGAANVVELRMGEASTATDR